MHLNIEYVKLPIKRLNLHLKIEYLTLFIKKR